MRCPYCHGSDDKVVDSRGADSGSAIRRRRECLGCGRRYTTYERVEALPLVVLKRGGEREPFEPDKVAAGIRRAAKNRPLDAARVAEVVEEVHDQMQAAGPEVSSEAVGVAVLERLRDLDPVAYLRFASVYKEFSDPRDFEREVALLQKGLEKTTAPKRRGRSRS
ncbi:MAG: transcriptional regulator NrdR [Acidimicrobiia bacterium]|nr:transcriptional repressor NrdR [Acidimicrobiia bacterium]MCL4293782.1 transcriptional regulator NrdR [Acidimicrobiia bacterium]